MLIEFFNEDGDKLHISGDYFEDMVSIFVGCTSFYLDDILYDKVDSVYDFEKNKIQFSIEER